jgi:DNA-binding beta-propeller fold protein YncE
LVIHIVLVGRVVAVVLSLALAVPTRAADARAGAFELWVVDQANAAHGGDALYVYPSSDLGKTPDPIYLFERAAGVGDGPGVRPHLLAFNSTRTHAVLANVASGHVYVIRAADRAIVASIDVGEQAHGAVPSPDDRWILAANQNGKRLARISADFVNERFAHDAAADLDLKVLEDDQHPDNAPICPVMYVGSPGKAYVSMRGGGMYVVDTLASPMAVVRQYGKDQIGAAGCGGLVAGGRAFVNSGSPLSGNVYAFDTSNDEIVGVLDTTPHGTDAHGMVLVGDRYLWMSNRGEGDNVVIIDTRTLETVGKIEDVGAAPDIMDISPAGDRVFTTLRGPQSLTGGPSAVGLTPGVAVLAVEHGGAAGRRVDFLPIGPQEQGSRNDPHGLAVRPLN